MLGVLLERLGLSFPARLCAVGSFAVTTAFHECLYWPAATNFSLALAFSLGAVTLLSGPRGGAWRPALAFFLGLLGLLCASLAAAPLLLAPVTAWVLARERRKAAALAAVAAVFASLLAVAVLIPWLLQAPPGAGGSFSRFDPAGGLRLTLRSMTERLAGRYFTGGPLPWAAGAGLLLALTALAGFGGKTRRGLALSLAYLWMAVPSFAVLAFRSWLGDVVFASRYQLVPAVGLAMLVALAAEALFERLGTGAPRFVRPLPLAASFLVLVFGLQAYAARVVQSRWLERTAALGRAHREIAASLRQEVAALAPGDTLALRNHAVGGGTGYRPRLQVMSRYLLSDGEWRRLRWTPDEAGLDPRLAPLAEAVGRGEHNWLAWLDDLAVSQGGCPSAAGARTLPATVFFPRRELGRFVDEGDVLAVTAFGQGQLPSLGSGEREDLPHVGCLSLPVGSAAPGEILVRLVGPGLYDDGLGARLRTTGPTLTPMAIDFSLATRGHAAEVREVRLEFVYELTSYRLGPITLSGALP